MIPLLVECAGLMRSVPGAVATGSQRSRRGESARIDPVAIASGTDLTARHKFKTRENGKRLRVLHCTHKLGQRILRVSVEHAGVRLEEERILEPGKSFALSALQHHH